MDKVADLINVRARYPLFNQKMPITPKIFPAAKGVSLLRWL